MMLLVYLNGTYCDDSICKDSFAVCTDRVDHHPGTTLIIICPHAQVALVSVCVVVWADGQCVWVWEWGGLNMCMCVWRGVGVDII